MGSGFSYDEAARRLGKSRRTIYNYVDSGFIRKEYDSERRVILNRDDVEQLAVSLGVGQPAFNRKNFYMLSARVRSLEEKVSLLQRIYGIGEAALRPNPDEARGLIAHAGMSITNETWAFEELEMWANVFERIDEETLDMMVNATARIDCWEVLMRLLKAQLSFLGQHPDFKIGLGVPALHQRLELARNRLRQTCVLWLEMNKGLEFKAVPDALNTPKDDILARLTSRKSNSGG